MNKSEKQSVIQINKLSKHFKLKAGLFSSGKQSVKALNNTTLTIEPGSSYGIVGESGSGKSTLAKTIAGGYRITSGEVNYHFKDGTHLNFNAKSSLHQFRKIASGRIRYIFQDPAASMNPRMSIKEILLSGYRGSRLWTNEKEAIFKAKEILEKIGLPEDALERRSADFSGGQRQRISIARALMHDPEILICDEVVSALDLSIQSQILNLLAQLKKEFGFTLIFISHDLTVVSYICDEIAVFYGGRIMELSGAEELIKSPKHPYSQLLYNSMPGTQAGKKEIFERGGEIYSPVHPPAGCPFEPRCPIAIEQCSNEVADLKQCDGDGYLSCWVKKSPPTPSTLLLK